MKFVVTILAFIYLTASVGTTIHFHYCMDKLVNAGLWHNNDKKCGKCGMDKSHEGNKGCCKDEHKQLKLENDHKGVSTYQLTELASVLLPVPLFELPHINLPTVTEQNPLSHAPPRRGDIAVYIQNCVFRI
ncbi:MAG: HYC_CC_PP family protein [Chitinophagaceae bacterium]